MSPRGGKRRGAGRPPTGRPHLVAVTVRLDPEEVERLDRERRPGESRSSAARRMLAERRDR